MDPQHQVSKHKLSFICLSACVQRRRIGNGMMKEATYEQLIKKRRKNEIIIKKGETG
jgi:hypothetical protein